MNPNNAIILVVVLITLIIGLGTWFLVHALNTGLTDYAQSRLYRDYPVGAGGVTYVPAAPMPTPTGPPPAPAPAPAPSTNAASEKSEKTSKTEP